MWCAEAGVPVGTTPTDILLADVYAALTGEPHPLRPKPRGTRDPGQAHALSAVERLRAQRERLKRTQEGPPNG